MMKIFEKLKIFEIFGLKAVTNQKVCIAMTKVHNPEVLIISTLG